jgi:hypothetical protein
MTQIKHIIKQHMSWQRFAAVGLLIALVVISSYQPLA